MNSSYGPSRNPQDAHSTSSPKPLSCISCRQRKIKCNKIDPCNHCQKLGVFCQFPPRARGRRKQNAKERETELLQRINRLESLVGRFEGPKPVFNDEEIQQEVELGLSPRNELRISQLGNMRVDDEYASFVQEQSSHYIGGDFWKNLSDEVDGLKQLLAQEEEDDEEEETNILTPSSSATMNSPPQFLFGDLGNYNALEVHYPSDSHRPMLFQLYFENVHPICGLIHKPTAVRLLSNMDQITDSSNGGRFKFRSIEAVSFALYFAAVTSISPEGCLAMFGEDRDVLLTRYKRCTESAFIQADILNSMEIVTLQALTIYIMALRCHDHSRVSWTLIGLAVRIAHGLGIHKDGDGLAFIPQEAEIRRRLWWQIIVLDMRAAEDRGSEPLIVDGTFNTRMPCNINDEDFNLTTKHPLVDKQGITDMSLCLLSMESSMTARKLHFGLPNEHLAMTLAQREEILKQYNRRVEARYLANCNSDNKMAWVIYMISRIFTARGLTVLQYPLRPVQNQFRRPMMRSLGNAVAVLETIESVESAPSMKNFLWYFSTYVPWHTLAVALAELCSAETSPLTEKAWPIVERSYVKFSKTIADSKGGMLWRPMKKLYKRAQDARQREQNPVEPTESFEIPQHPLPQADHFDLDSSNLNLETAHQNFYDPVTAFDSNLMNQSTSPQFASGLFPFPSVNFSNINPGPEDFDGNLSWDDWNQFVDDVGATTVDLSHTPLGF
ncbi:hypothetical protein B7494_g830 [Chlorociboria aeruginascens]|nr:hypothetical protein B7494_g830 [Chlorociboria aeruginascens]